MQRKIKKPEAYHVSFDKDKRKANIPGLPKTPTGAGRNKFFSKARSLAAKKTGMTGIAQPHPPIVHRKPVKPKRG